MKLSMQSKLNSSLNLKLYIAECQDFFFLLEIIIESKTLSLSLCITLRSPALYRSRKIETEKEIETAHEIMVLIT